MNLNRHPIRKPVDIYEEESQLEAYHILNHHESSDESKYETSESAIFSWNSTLKRFFRTKIRRYIRYYYLNTWRRQHRIPSHGSE